MTVPSGSHCSTALRRVSGFVTGLIVVFLLVLAGIVVAQATSVHAQSTDLKRALWREQASKFDKLMVQQRYVPARVLAKKALAAARDAFPNDSIELGAAYGGIALSFFQRQMYEDAEPISKDTLRILHKARGKRDTLYVANHELLAIIYFKTGRVNKAERLFKEVLATREAVQGAEHPHVASSLYNLGIVCDVQDKHSEAELYFRQAMVIREKAPVRDKQGLSMLLRALAETCYTQGKHDEAIRFEERLKEIQINQNK